MNKAHELMFRHLLDAKLPGFYTDVTGALCVIIGNQRIAAFIDENTSEFNVTVDTIDDSGDFAKNISWESYKSHDETIAELRKQVAAAAKNTHRVVIV